MFACFVTSNKAKINAQSVTKLFKILNKTFVANVLKAIWEDDFTPVKKRLSC